MCIMRVIKMLLLLLKILLRRWRMNMLLRLWCDNKIVGIVLKVLLQLIKSILLTISILNIRLHLLIHLSLSIRLVLLILAIVIPSVIIIILILIIVSLILILILVIILVRIIIIIVTKLPVIIWCAVVGSVIVLTPLRIRIRICVCVWIWILVILTPITLSISAVVNSKIGLTLVAQSNIKTLRSSKKFKTTHLFHSTESGISRIEIN